MGQPHTTVGGLEVKPPRAPAQILARAPARHAFQLNVSETQGSTNQKSFIKTVLNEKPTFAQRKVRQFCFLSKIEHISNEKLKPSWHFWLRCSTENNCL